MSASGNAADSDIDALLRRFRRGNYLSMALLVISVLGFVILLGSDWSWPFFAWGIGAGLLAVAGMRATMRLAYRFAPADEVGPSRRRVRQRYGHVYVTMVVLGVVFGALSASMPSATPDIAFTVCAIIGPLPGLAALPRLRRKARSSAAKLDS